MNRLLRISILIFPVFYFATSIVFAEVIDLQGTWLFKKGDDPAWSQIDFPDSAWDYIGVPQVWESAGDTNYNGYAWYRKSIFIPDSWRLDKYVQLKKNLLLELALIDDVERTYFNNHLIGQTGSFPPHLEPPQNSTHRYEIPLDLIRWGAENVIAIRVYDTDEIGGFYAGKPKLRMPSIIDDCSVSLELDRKNHIYQMGEPVFATVTVQNNASETFSATLDFILKSVRGGIAENQQQEFEILPGKTKSFRFRFRARIPDFYQLDFRIGNGYDTLFETCYNLGYNVERLNLPLTAEDDFTEFWNRTKLQLRFIPVQPKIERIDTLDLPARHVFRVRLLSFDDVYIYGWYLVPRGRGNFPTILHVGTKLSEIDWQLERLFSNVALFLMEIREPVNRDARNSGYFVSNITDKEKYFCRGAMMDCLRAVDFLFSRSEVDTACLGVAGNGFGGGLALAATALDPRIKAVAIDSPLMIAYELVTRLSTHSHHEIVQYLVEHPSEKNEIFKTLSYFDLLNFASLIQAPVLMSVMLTDRISPPLTASAVYNRIPGNKQQIFYPLAAHGFTSIAHETEKAQWFKQHLKIK